jgi:hypothetical protein
MPPNMTDEVDSQTTRSLVVLVPVQAQRSEKSFEFSLEQWGGLAASSVARALGTHQDDVLMGTRPDFEWTRFS